MKKNILKFAALNAFGTAAYIALVATFLTNAGSLFGTEEKKTVLIPIAMLLLLVLSASVTSLLVLGRPIIWFLDGKKKEAVSLLAATLAFLFLIMLAVFLTLAFLLRG